MLPSDQARMLARATIQGEVRRKQQEVSGGRGLLARAAGAGCWWRRAGCWRGLLVAPRRLLARPVHDAPRPPHPPTRPPHPPTRPPHPPTPPTPAAAQVFEKCTDTAQELAKFVERAGEGGGGLVAAAAKAVLPIPGLK